VFSLPSQIEAAGEFAETFWAPSSQEPFGKVDKDRFRASLKEASGSKGFPGAVEARPESFLIVRFAIVLLDGGSPSGKLRPFHTGADQEVHHENIFGLLFWAGSGPVPRSLRVACLYLWFNGGRGLFRIARKKKESERTKRSRSPWNRIDFARPHVDASDHR